MYVETALFSEGKSFVEWIQESLVHQPFQVSVPDEDKSGWGFFAEMDGEEYRISVSSEGKGSDDALSCWKVGIAPAKPLGFLARFRKPKTAHRTTLENAVYGAIKKEPAILVKEVCPS